MYNKLSNSYGGHNVAWNTQTVAQIKPNIRRPSMLHHLSFIDNRANKIRKLCRKPKLNLF